MSDYEFLWMFLTIGAIAAGVIGGKIIEHKQRKRDE